MRCGISGRARSSDGPARTPLFHWLTRVVVLGLLALTCGPLAVSAQTHRTYAGAAMALAQSDPRTVSDGSPSTTFINTSTRKTAIGFLGEFGRLVRPRLTVGVEIGVPARQSVTQAYYYFSPYLRASRYRDVTMMGVVRYEVKDTGRVHVAASGGGGVVQQSSLEQFANGQFGSTLFVPYGAEAARTRWTFAATGGGEVSVAAPHRLSVVSQLRVLAIARGSRLDRSSFADLGFPTYALRGSLGLRVAF